ncbi:hypothetical protein [Gluconacetobacter dulcium]
MKTAVETVFMRTALNDYRRFLQLFAHVFGRAAGLHAGGCFRRA